MVLFVTFTLALTQTVVSVVGRSAYANAVCAVGFPERSARGGPDRTSSVILVTLVQPASPR